MINPNDYLKAGQQFHGHKCPAMPMGLRVGAAAMNALGVDRACDGQPAGCCSTQTACCTPAEACCPPAEACCPPAEACCTPGCDC